MTVSAHIYQPAVITFNKAWFDKLPPDLQKIVIDEGRKIVRSGRAAIRKMNPALVKIIEKAGVKISTLTPEQRAEFVKKTAGVNAKVKGRSAAVKETVLLIEAGLAEYRAKAKKK
jgi:TRAP-type C4-dicarboxylate transport system substrate-binding protein